MTTKVLVAYASKYGATAEIAEKIGEVLRQEGLQVDVLPVKKIKDPAAYDTFILGSAAYIGQWRKDMVKFLKANQDLLSGRPAWLFSSGPLGEGDPVELLKGERFPASLKSAIEHIRPRDVAVFHGSINLEILNPFERFIFKKVSNAQGDYRDWNAITSWAQSIAGALKK